MKICFPHNTATMVGGVLTHFAAGEHDVDDAVGAALVEAGDALKVEQSAAKDDPAADAKPAKASGKK